MFGLENKGGKKDDSFFFDLEEEVKDPNKFAKVKDRIQSRLMKIKALLRSGADQEDFERLGDLVYGYTSALKVLNKVNAPKKK